MAAKKDKTKKDDKTLSNSRLLFGAILILMILFLLNNLNNIGPFIKNTIRDKESVTKEVRQENTLQVSGVKMVDFFERSGKPEETEYVPIVKDRNYHIFYFAPDELFIISIVGYPYDKFLPIAEENFLTELNISKEDACKLNVSITTPMYANPEKAGKTYSLSFCGS